MKIFLPFQSVAAAALMATTASAQLPPGKPLEPVEDYVQRLQAAFDEKFQEQSEAFAWWIGVADPDYGDLYFVFGNATGPSPPQEPATLDHIFDIGSISKTVGGTLIMLLAEEGLLSLTDTVGELVPNFTAEFPQYENNTVEELLRMKTIVPDFVNDENGKSGI